jgi:RNA polymerase sigma-70 factor
VTAGRQRLLVDPAAYRKTSSKFRTLFANVRYDGTVTEDRAGDGSQGVPVAHELHARGRAHWPELPLSLEQFASHLARHIPAEADPVAYARSLVAEDLYLACACVQDLPGAVNAFDARFLSRVPDYVRHIDRSPGFGDEIRQQLRERLLVRRPDGPARIADYSGRGALASWLRVTAVRVALDHRARPADDRIDDTALLDELATEASPERDVVRRRYAEAMTAALRRAVAALAPEQRVILRMYFAAGHTTQQIATLLRVDRSTAARRLVAARKAVFDHTHHYLRAELPVETGEFASLARALHDQLDVSLGGLLADPD